MADTFHTDNYVLHKPANESTVEKLFLNQVTGATKRVYYYTSILRKSYLIYIILEKIEKGTELWKND